MASVITLRDLTEALIEVAKEGAILEKVTSDLEKFFKIISSQEEIKNALGSPVYKTEEKKSIVVDIGNELGFDEITVNFLNLVIEVGRFKALVKSQGPFMQRIKRASGRVKAEVITSVTPSDADLQKIKEALNRLVEKDVELTLKVDPGILGGVIAKVEDRVFDGSIRTQLERIRRTLSTD
ncbi:MAG: ATP synthase F1 subunit delta [Candidatus Dadabacteria bacterium]